VLRNGYGSCVGLMPSIVLYIILGCNIVRYMFMIEFVDCVAGGDVMFFIAISVCS
jgi:hypothetical protein